MEASRFYDFLAGDLLHFSMVRLYRQRRGDWKAALSNTMLRTWRSKELASLLAESDFALRGTFGSYAGERFQPLDSEALLIGAQLAGP